MPSPYPAMETSHWPKASRGRLQLLPRTYRMARCWTVMMPIMVMIQEKDTDWVADGLEDSEADRVPAKDIVSEQIAQEDSPEEEDPSPEKEVLLLPGQQGFVTDRQNLDCLSEAQAEAWATWAKRLRAVARWKSSPPARS